MAQLNEVMKARHQLAGGLIMLKILERSNFISTEEYEKIFKAVETNGTESWGEKFMMRVRREADYDINRLRKLVD
jgi:methenyltetrahydromethanopterin cyclohydrolase